MKKMIFPIMAILLLSAIATAGSSKSGHYKFTCEPTIKTTEQYDINNDNMMEDVTVYYSKCYNYNPKHNETSECKAYFFGDTRLGSECWWCGVLISDTFPYNN